MWTALVNAFQSHSQARVLQLQTQLQMIQRKSDSIHEYTQRIKTISNNLTVIGHPILGAHLIMHVLNGLSSAYDNLTSNIATRVNY